MALREARSCRVLTKAFPVNNAKVNSKVLKSQLKKGRSPWLPARAGEQSCYMQKFDFPGAQEDSASSQKDSGSSQLPRTTEGIGKRAQSQNLTLLEQRSISAEVLGQ